ncbi:hypothetical protein ACLB2K_007209 [Fragaria x ananassa]
MEARRKKGVVTSTTAVIAEGVVRVLDVLFNGVERKNKAAVVMNKKSAPNGHAEKAVTLKLCALLKKETNVITEGTQWENRMHYLADGLERVLVDLSSSTLQDEDDVPKYFHWIYFLFEELEMVSTNPSLFFYDIS